MKECLNCGNENVVDGTQSGLEYHCFDCGFEWKITEDELMYWKPPVPMESVSHVVVLVGVLAVWGEERV